MGDGSSLSYFEEQRKKKKELERYVNIVFLEKTQITNKRDRREILRARSSFLTRNKNSRCFHPCFNSSNLYFETVAHNVPLNIYIL